MANYEKAFGELVDVVKHLVSTHVRWNQDLSHDDAIAKLDAVKILAVADDVQEIASDLGNDVKDVVTLVKDVKDGGTSNG